ncbi:MAG: transcriptional repressor [Candidatus Fournierella pullistercoris]|uniref:Transcriptional repressor n=1 Tax=Candidatus Allofournierella pullistercoris TaxID=2838597 RepID=A0A948WQC7_9FIRM|nr:transcriptional repressor [Candidatus Fournierella pullistercoris]
MAPKQGYRTRQGEELLQYLQSIPGQHCTVNDICLHFSSQGRSIGVATVYRHLERMVEQGMVHKYTVDAGTPACFVYKPESQQEGCGQSFHCKCDCCGALIHLECGQLEQLTAHLMEHHGFVINPMRTVLYGLCQSCRQKQEQTAHTSHSHTCCDCNHH